MSDVLDQIQISRPASARRQLAQSLRQMILSGQAAEGYKFPSNQELSDRWQVARSSIQAAMNALAKEGLIVRTRKRGTFVAGRSTKLTHIAVYLSGDIWHLPAATMRRTLVAMLVSELEKRRIVADMWIDPRPAAEQDKPWPEMVAAADQRRFGAIVMTSSTPEQQRWLARLPVPSTGLTRRPARNFVTIDFSGAERLAVSELAKQGCRSVGMVCAVPILESEQANRFSHISMEQFRRVALEAGMECRDEWFQIPARAQIVEADAEQFGYTRMKRLLAMQPRPDGVLVFHDLVARGALMAVMKSKLSVPEELKLVLYRNVETGLFCPAAAAFLDVRIADIASAMVDSVLAQLKGEETEAITISPTICAPAQAAWH